MKKRTFKLQILLGASAALLSSACLANPLFTSSTEALFAEFEHLQPLPGYPGENSSLFKFGATLHAHPVVFEAEWGKSVGEWLFKDSVQSASAHEYIANIKMGLNWPLFPWLQLSALGGGNFSQLEGDDCPLNREDEYCKDSDKHRLGAVASARATFKFKQQSLTLSASRYWLTTHLHYESVALSYRLWTD